MHVQEEKALALQKDLSSMTNTCVHSEHELQNNKMKVFILLHEFKQ